jgi:hypothetical protein
MFMVKNDDNLELRQKHARDLIAAEQAADKITAELHRLLHRMLVAPLDRDQIRRLINAMDGVVLKLVVLASLFDFVNDFHDTANSIAMVVSTGLLKPVRAAALAAVSHCRDPLPLTSRPCFTASADCCSETFRSRAAIQRTSGRQRRWCPSRWIHPAAVL